ncbi:MAG: hypothetical protein O7C62_08155, partial [Rickettsia endosymbiont of Ixodes persulcatus]|nr:hypothetical protein [Rickettsia endosymbiont of Ixodes persulcatus]
AFFSIPINFSNCLKRLSRNSCNKVPVTSKATTVTTKSLTVLEKNTPADPHEIDRVLALIKLLFSSTCAHAVGKKEFKFFSTEKINANKWRLTYDLSGVPKIGELDSLTFFEIIKYALNQGRDSLKEIMAIFVTLTEVKIILYADEKQLNHMVERAAELQEHFTEYMKVLLYGKVKNDQSELIQNPKKELAGQSNTIARLPPKANLGQLMLQALKRNATDINQINLKIHLGELLRITTTSRNNKFA